MDNDFVKAVEAAKKACYEALEIIGTVKIVELTRGITIFDHKKHTDENVVSEHLHAAIRELHKYV